MRSESIVTNRIVCLLVLVFPLLFLCGCAVTPKSANYQSMYCHLKNRHADENNFSPSDYFLVILVDARHLDYSDNHSFFKTVAKHPSDGSKNGDVGHAWIYLQGLRDGIPIYLEGGYSGESGEVQAKYFDGMMNYIDFGYANPTPEQMAHSRYEPNPVKYLWEIQHDGFFQRGSGTHRPSYAAKIDITPEQFERIISFVESYPYCEYSLINSQCSSFAVQIASLAGLDLDCEVTIPIEPSLVVCGQKLRFWTDPAYAQLTVSSPDVLERSLMQAVDEGKADCALEWYLERNPEWFGAKVCRLKKTITRFPKRFCRYLMVL